MKEQRTGLSEGLLAMDLEHSQKIALKNMLSQFSAGAPGTKPLINLLSTIYVNESEARGLLASLQGNLSRTPIVMNRETMIDQSELLMDSLWMIDSILCEWMGFLEGEIEKSSGHTS